MYWFSKRRYLAVIMVVTMLFSMLPLGLFAAMPAKGADQIVTFKIGQANYQKGGTRVGTDVSPYIKDGRTMVPVAFVAPALGTDKATWIPETQMVRINRGDDLIMIKIGSRELVVNGKVMMMDTAAEIKDIGGGGGRTMLPISFIAKALGVGYQWNGETRSVDFYGYSENFDQAGTFGPATGSETIAGNVTVAAGDVRLQNKVVKGDLIIGESVGDGDVFLDNITVEGNTYVRGGGKNSIHINGGSYTNVIIEDTPDGGTRVVATNTDGINIVVATAQAGEQVILEGTFANVEVTAANANVSTQGQTTIQNMTVNNTATVNVAAGTTVNTVTLNAVATVSGEGTVTNANVNTSGSTVTTSGTTITAAEGVTPPSTTTETTPATTTGGGGGGGGSTDDGGSDDPATISVSLEVPADEAHSYHMDVIVLNASTSAPITGLAKEDFTITFGESGSYPIDLIQEGGMTGEDGHYTLYPNDDPMVYCPVMGFNVRIPVGSYTLEFSKTGYEDASVNFEVTTEPSISTNTTIANGAVDPSVVVGLLGNIYNNYDSGMILSNWTIDEGTTGLTAGTIMRNSDTEVSIPFTGTAAEGTITIQALAAALSGDANSNTITVNVPGEAAATVTGIAVKTAPTTVTYTEGDALDLSGLEVTLTKSDSTTEDVAFADFATAGITAAPSNGTVIGTSVTEVTITHTASSQTTTQAITVNPAPVTNFGATIIASGDTVRIDKIVEVTSGAYTPIATGDTLTIDIASGDTVVASIASGDTVTVTIASGDTLTVERSDNSTNVPTTGPTSSAGKDSYTFVMPAIAVEIRVE